MASILMHLLETALDEGVTESEGCGGKAVQDGGIHLNDDHNDDTIIRIMMMVTLGS